MHGYINKLVHMKLPIYDAFSLCIQHVYLIVFHFVVSSTMSGLILFLLLKSLFCRSQIVYLIQPLWCMMCTTQCKREGFLQRIKEEDGEGCNVYGFLEVNKVAGNFHFAPGKSFQQSGAHVHDLLAFQKDSFNVRHNMFFHSLC